MSEDNKENKSSSQNDSAWIRTVVLMALVLPIVGWLLYFAYQKHTEMEPRTKQCQTECSEQGTLGYQFKWTILSGPVCECINE